MSTLGWVVAGATFASATVAVMIGRSRFQPYAWAIPLIWLFALVGFGLTLPSEPTPPFHAGSRLGWGLLLGSGLWMLGAYFGMGRTLPWLAAAFPLLSPAMIFWFSADEPQPATYGVLISTALVWCTLRNAWRELPAIALCVFASCACLGLVYFVAPHKPVPIPSWRSAPLWLEASGLLGLITVILWRRGITEKVSWRVAHVLVFTMLVLGTLFIRNQFAVPNAINILFFSLVAITLASAFSADRGFYASRNSLLVWIGLFACVFALQRGYALSLAALIVSLYNLAMAHTDEIHSNETARDTYTLGAALLTMLALFRIFVLTYPLRTPRADLYTHYTLVGFLLAIGGLAFLAAWWMEDRNSDDSPNFWRGLTAGFWGAASPVAMTALFGIRAGAGWLAGSMAALLATFAFGVSRQVMHYMLPLIFAGIAATLPFTAIVEGYADLPRWTRGGMIGVLALMMFITIAVNALIQRKSRMAES
jgi:hypothetical protein